ncbi:PepSY-associated TM helix domain-containing protein [Dyadobacter sediminis]|uniref:PepSY domain-containing protein n=1 Tax=Dyadobacter sediminis TaxID=1493691 RepID=A0A5R9KB77_9BACT|nr:PepSY-associated TM helix domain-containing protein [Dyadobacter sediminis]TLU92018.1 PepSY domain-containing protein [Dyadobacter sediminis]GGB98148.1 membrane protein [Dyadobacter sediminis]
MKFKKVVSFLHLWLGLVSGLSVFLIAISGCLYVFVDELKPIVYHERLFVAPENKEKLPLTQLLSIAQNTLGKDKIITRIEMANAPDRSVTFRSQKNNPDGLTHWDYFEYYYRVYINPYTGKVIYVEDSKNEFFQLVLALHMRMLFGEKVGHYVVGYSVLSFIIILISGVILWFPKKWTAKSIKNHFTVKWRAKWKRLNYDLHQILGLYAFFILLLTSLTGLVWAFDWMQDSVRFVANGGKNIQKPALLVSDTLQPQAVSGLDQAFTTTATGYPDAYAYLVLLPAKATSTINTLVYKKDWNRFDRLLIVFDRYSGKMLSNTSFQDLNNGDKAYQLNFDLHTGAYMGLFGKILSFFSALACSTLPITGFYIWCGKRKKERLVRNGKVHARLI